MKKLIVLLMVLAASGIYGAEYVPVTVSYGDGSDILRPDTAHAIVYLHKDTYIDSLVFDTTADWVTTAGGFLLDSVLSSSYTGEWYTIRYYVVKNNDAVVWEEEWHAKYLVDTASIARSAWDNDVIAQASRIANANAIQISGDATAADNFETMLDGTGGNEFTLKRLRLTTTTADDTALIIKSTAGTGASIYGDDDAFALYATSGDGLKITATTNGINAWGVTGSDILGDVNGTIVPTDTTATGQPVNLMPATATAADTAAYQGSASGLDSATVQSAVIAAMNAETTMRLKSLYIIDDVDDDTAAVLIKSTADHAAEFNAAGSNDAFRRIANSGKAEYNYAGGATGKATVWGTAAKQGGYAWHVYSTGSADAIRWNTETGNDTGDVWEIVAGGTDTTIHNMAWQVEGLSYWHGRDNRDEDGLRIHAYNNGIAGYLWSDNRAGLRISNTAGNDTSIVLGGSIRFGANQGIVGYVDTVLKSISATANLTGSGDYAMTVWAIDTSGTDDTVSSVDVKVRDATGTSKGDANTLSDGKIVFNLDSGSYTLSGMFANGYYWNDLTCTLSTADTMNLLGYDIALDTAGVADKTCLVLVTVVGSDGTAAENVWVTASLVNGNVADSAGNAVSGTTKKVKTDSNGRATFTCVWSSYLVPATDWRFRVGNVYKDITVPRQASYTVDF